MFPETVRNVDIPDALYSKQKEDVAKMRASLLSCSDDVVTSTQALQNITILRIYHQVSRIIRYLEMMDKIEDKLYESLDYYIEHMSIESPASYRMLLSIQEQLQKNLIDSHKLLQPYLNVDELSLQSLMPVSYNSPNEDVVIIPKSSRDKLRQNAQQVLAFLNEVDN